MVVLGALADQPFNLYFVESDDAKCLDGTSPVKNISSFQVFLFLSWIK